MYFLVLLPKQDERILSFLFKTKDSQERRGPKFKVELEVSNFAQKLLREIVLLVVGKKGDCYQPSISCSSSRWSSW